jgi:hypothetical protein
MIRSTVWAVVTATAMAACLKPQSDSVAEALDALPTSDALAIRMPAQAATGMQKVGDVAWSYVVTRGVATTLNGGAAFVLVLAKTVTSFPVTSIAGDTYIWGPWSEALKPGEYRMTVRLTSDGEYAWTLEGRTKGTTDAFQVIVSGVATPGHPHQGSGNFTIDFDVAKSIDPLGGDAAGQLSVSYDLEHAPATIAMDAEKLAPTPTGGSALQTLHYEYTRAADDSGSLSFQRYGDTEDPGPLWETTQITSRWLASGAGRADLTVTGGDLGVLTVTASECWSTQFLRTYFSASVGGWPAEGTPASCALP